MDPKTTHELFEKLLNAGDIEGLTALYEPEATFVDREGKLIKGAGAIREFLLGFLSIKPQIRVQHARTLDAGDVAVLVSRWEVSGERPDGSPVADHGLTHDVVRRQPDGTWRTVIGNPWAGAA